MPASPSPPIPTTTDRIRGALWGMMIGDALAMPAHWYYRLSELQRDFGVIRDYQAPKELHPSSIMSLSSTSGAGRGNQAGDVVGEVILKGKKHHWGPAGRHYHQGMQAGENTLNALCARLILRSLCRTRTHDTADFLAEYVQFMTTEGSHNDTYAESYHRDFFANWVRGVPAERCAGATGHDTASIGGLVGLAPVVLAVAAQGDMAQAVQAGLKHLRLTHRSQPLEVFAAAYCRLLAQLVFAPPQSLIPLLQEQAPALGKGLSALLGQAADHQGPVTRVVGGLYSPACYIEDSFPSVLYLAARYPNDFESALIANTNAGGDNCHRGSVLGALLGAWLGFEAIPLRWRQGLLAGPTLTQELDEFIQTFVPSSSPETQRDHAA
jgi:ADP-ribosyl-[dinitrogen reductase] hydrolase